MAKDTHVDILTVLSEAPVLSRCQRQDIARLLPHVEERRIASNGTLFKSTQPANTTYLICSGTLALVFQGNEVDHLASGWVGEEASLDMRTYLADAIAVTPLTVIAIPSEVLLSTIPDTPVIISELSSSLIKHYAKSPQKIAVDSPEKQKKKPVPLMRPVGWLAALLVAPIVYYYGSTTGYDSRAVDFLAVFSITTIMWIFRLLPEFIPAIFLVLASVILGVVPTKTALSGFVSGSFFMAMSVFAIGAVLVRSGLTYRIALWLLKRSPESQIGYQTSMLLLGISLTPLLPSANARVTLTLPLLRDIIQSVRYKPGERPATGLAAASFAGAAIFSPLFMTSKSINFAVYGLFPAQVQYQFSWGYWTMAAAVAGLVLLLFHFSLSWLLFHNHDRPSLDSERLQSQLSIMGPISRDEWIALGALGLFLLGVLTTSLHQIPPPWIGMSVFFILLALGLLTNTNVRRDINWPFLLLLAGMISIVQTMNYLGLDNVVAHKLEWLGVYMRESIYQFLLLASLTIFMIRLIVPNNATIILVCSIFLPIAATQGVNAWVIAFLVLVISDGWFMSYQSTYYLAFRDGAEEGGEGLYDKRRMLIYNALMNLGRVAAIMASVPYWQGMHLL
ncbi:cyclic nucleotide-binding domain-containing protein [Thiohalocapsa marina]|uniref:Cyclic nucleotide-binding domain-containing protein n=1 Tax=Thiohalocapsa marina TaxID=424902 RepID=A0A5M8FQ09_9GAMM|nr:SLC13 family permease [Thiohalocapsa marina]KAA6184525.1 cyclic nucleotide-binding domain-containing protein [Thiohalocapsa marina]